MVTINGESYEVNGASSLEFGSGVVLDTDGGEWVIFQDAEEAGKAAAEYWHDLADNDPKEFTALVGEDTLVSWALGQSAGPGSVAVNSLEEWLELVADHPEEEWGSWDGQECECTIDEETSGMIYQDTGQWIDEGEAVAYRR